MHKFLIFFVLVLLTVIVNAQPIPLVRQAPNIIVGAQNFGAYINDLEGKKVAVVANQASLVFYQDSSVHLVDKLLEKQVSLTKIFTPEHGFRGEAGAGEKVQNSIDQKTNLPIVSLYGSHKKPTPDDLEGVDLVLFDLQDVGVRFYTYISTLHYVMEACAEQNIPVIVLDRPNPNRHYVDGPVLEEEYSSFVGMHPVPVVYGMTIGEYARMINGEKWLANEVICDLKVAPCLNYNQQSFYLLPERPSPNLPNYTSVYLYPSLCFFEGTIVSVGRGTDFPFQVYGHPDLDRKSFEFKPKSRIEAKTPKLENKWCKGQDLRILNLDQLQKFNQLRLDWLVSTYNELKTEDFFNDFFEKLAGTGELRRQIQTGATEQQIRGAWTTDLNRFKKTRSKYLLY